MEAKMVIRGLKVNAKPIADGIYEYIVKNGDEAIVAFGMIPIEAENLLTRLLREKLIELWAKQECISIATANQVVDERELRAIAQPIHREIICGMSAALVERLKAAGEDHEFYPTTNEIIARVARDIDYGSEHYRHYRATKALLTIKSALDYAGCSSLEIV